MRLSHDLEKLNAKSQETSVNFFTSIKLIKVSSVIRGALGYSFNISN